MQTMQQPDGHIGEDAELYVLGELSELERARLERHVATCDACARRVGEAEEAMLSLMLAESESVSPAAPPAQLRPIAFSSVAGATRRAWLSAVAAAFLIGLMPWAITRLVTQPAAPAQATAQVALNAMLAGHFAHVPFKPLVSDAPRGKVIYDLKGAWIYVLVGAGSEPLTVAVVPRGGARETIATISPGSGARTALVSLGRRVDTVDLLRSGVVVETARPEYGSEPPPSRH
jgi:hypothetical protein